MVEPAEKTLYRWPTAAKFGRVVPKTKFYEHATISAAIKDKFVSDVRRINWTYKLAESTINLPGNAEVPEIQVFEIEAKDEDVAEAVLTAIDKAVRTPIIFEITRGEGAHAEVRMVAAHKQLGTSSSKLGPYFTTGWRRASAERSPLPTAIELTSLYASLLLPLTSVETRVGEIVSDVVSRLTAARALEREVVALEKKLRNEKQLNRKLELRRTLKAKQATLAELTSATASPASGNAK